MGKRRLRSQRRNEAAWAGITWRWQVAAPAGGRPAIDGSKQGTLHTSLILRPGERSYCGAATQRGMSRSAQYSELHGCMSSDKGLSLMAYHSSIVL
ncbi:hypothetical protein EJB05_51729 [Eragrostis curvula]|uniref:Uncharacterized protein n=1 Tax=Eragrostis curvula TaxID=38414 RepID=A0A5J9SUT9_9POAL|nr:hypothetical protein EJB05_51729 [Eragrostis curvula]